MNMFLMMNIVFYFFIYMQQSQRYSLYLYTSLSIFNIYIYIYMCMHMCNVCVCTCVSVCMCSCVLFFFWQQLWGLHSLRLNCKQVRFLKSQLCGDFPQSIQQRADFWEFLPSTFRTYAVCTTGFSTLQHTASRCNTLHYTSWRVTNSPVCAYRATNFNSPCVCIQDDQLDTRW